MQARKSAIAAWSRWVRRVGRHVMGVWLSKAGKGMLTTLLLPGCREMDSEAEGYRMMEASCRRC